MKSQGTTLTCDRELLTVSEMTKRGLPPQKIEAVVARGGGVPGPDLPGDVSLMKFWVSTATKKTDKEEVNLETKMNIQAQASGAAVDGFFNSNMGPQGGGSLGTANIQELINQVNQAGLIDSYGAKLLAKAFGFYQEFQQSQLKWTSKVASPKRTKRTM